MAARKTVKLTDVLEIANNMLDYDAEDCGLTKEEAVAARKAVATFAEALLFKADSYRGFAYTEKAGVARGADGIALRPFHCEDDSRRAYSIPGHCI